MESTFEFKKKNWLFKKLEKDLQHTIENSPMFGSNSTGFGIRALRSDFLGFLSLGKNWKTMTKSIEKDNLIIKGFVERQNGYIRIYNNNKIKYEGTNFINKKGFGRFYNDGTLLYEGEWKKDKKGHILYHGWGKKYISGVLIGGKAKNSLEYEGQWKNGEYHGWGKRFFRQYKISGYPQLDKPAVLVEGQWKNGKPCGYFQRRHFSGEILKEGQWNKNAETDGRVDILQDRYCSKKDNLSNIYDKNSKYY